METLKEIRVQCFDKGGVSPKAGETKTVRLSVYFDYEHNNHHIQIPATTDSREVCEALINLSERIANYNQTLEPPNSVGTNGELS